MCLTVMMVFPQDGGSAGWISQRRLRICACVRVQNGSLITNLREEIVVRPKNTAERLVGLFYGNEHLKLKRAITTLKRRVLELTAGMPFLCQGAAFH